MPSQLLPDFVSLQINDALSTFLYSNVEQIEAALNPTQIYMMAVYTYIYQIR